MNWCPYTKSRLAGRAAFAVWLVAAFLQAPAKVLAQPAILNALASESAAAKQKVDLETMPYTIRSGDFRLLVTPSFGVDWNDNINLSNSSPQQAFILKPMVQLDASYPITQIN